MLRYIRILFLRLLLHLFSAQISAIIVTGTRSQWILSGLHFPGLDVAHGPEPAIKARVCHASDIRIDIRNFAELERIKTGLDRNSIGRNVRYILLYMYHMLSIVYVLNTVINIQRQSSM